MKKQSNQTQFSLAKSLTSALLLATSMLIADAPIEQGTKIDFTDMYGTDCVYVIKKSNAKYCWKVNPLSASLVTYKLRASEIDLVEDRNYNPKHHTDRSMHREFSPQLSQYEEKENPLLYAMGHHAMPSHFKYSKKALYDSKSMINIFPILKTNLINLELFAQYEKEMAKKYTEVTSVSVLDFRGNNYDNNFNSQYKITKDDAEKNLTALKSPVLPTALFKILYNYDKDYVECFKYPTKKTTEAYKGDDIYKYHQASMFRLSDKSCTALRVNMVDYFVHGDKYYTKATTRLSSR